MSLSLATSPLAPDSACPQARTRIKATRAAGRPRAEVPKKIRKRSWYVEDEGFKRLAIHATMEGRSQSDIVNELLLGLNRYAMPAANPRASRSAPPMADTADTGEDRQEGPAA